MSRDEITCYCGNKTYCFITRMCEKCTNINHKNKIEKEIQKLQDDLSKIKKSL